MIIDHQLNPNKYTQEQLDANSDAAYDAAYARAYATVDAATVAVAAATATTYWINKYFMRSGENKQDYVDKINKDNKQ